MKVINLRLHYPHYQQDKLVEVSEEVFDVLCQSVREMRNHERRKRYQGHLRRTSRSSKAQRITQVCCVAAPLGGRASFRLARQIPQTLEKL